MAKSNLPTNYKDDIMDSSAEGKRKYRMIYNQDGTVSFEDVTPYQQKGSDYGALDVNTINKAVNESFDKNKIINYKIFICAFDTLNKNNEEYIEEFEKGFNFDFGTNKKYIFLMY